MRNDKTRYYGFSEGRLAYRYSKGHNDKESFTEMIELDGAQQPLFVKWSHFVYSSAGREGGEWSRLAQEVFPPAKPLPVNVDMDALQREAEDVKNIIAHEFQPRVEP